jgi:hypothetical protein
MKDIQAKPRVQVSEIGLFLKTIEIDYKPKDNQERAELITKYFPVLCLKEDVDRYEMFCTNPQEDYELLNRREEYFSKINSINPFK